MRQPRDAAGTWLWLVDFDNLGLSAVAGAGEQERPRRPFTPTVLETELQLDALVDRVIACLGARLGSRAFCELRLYGGWTDEFGYYTPQAQQLLTLLHRFRRRVKGHLLYPRLVETVAPLPQARLIGTLRVDCRRPRQKMVDALMNVDLAQLTISGWSGVAVISSDDDCVPGLLVAKMTPMVWLRQGSWRERPNDRLLAAQGIEILDWSAP